MKVALLVQGLYRTFDRCWPRWWSYLEPYSPDIFMLSHELDRLDDITRLPGNINAHFAPDDSQLEWNYGSRLGIGVKSLQVDLRQLRDLARLSEIVKETGKEYDWIIRLRTDLDLIIMPEPLEELDPAYCYVPCHCNWFGLNDRFMIGPPALVHTALQRYHQLPEYFAQGNPFHMETFLAWTMKDSPVRRTRTTFGVWRKEQRDPPYYNAQWGDVPMPDFFKRSF
jgi:hypothetical protein